MAIVVSLGNVDHDLVQAALGSEHELIQEPTAEQLALAAGAIVRASFTVDKQMFARMPNLKALARTGVGTERVNLGEATRLGIPVLITPGSNTNAVAEGALAMALHLSKRLAPLTELVREGRWAERDSLPLGDIEGATFGIIGWGRIGRRLGGIVQAMGGNLLVFDAYAEVPDAIRADSIEHLIANSEIISLHLPLTAENHGLFSTRLFTLMQPGTILLNCSRGPLIDLDAALSALKSLNLGGLGLDVFDEEPPKFHPVFEHPNVVLTPHVMGLSKRAARQTYIDAAVALREVLAGQPARNAAN